MSRLTLSLLGGFEANYERGTLRSFRSNKIRALLAYLAVESGRPHTRESLATLLWPQMSSKRARRNLRNSLSRLRRTLGVGLSDRLLDISLQDVTLDDDHLTLDVADFRRLLEETAAHHGSEQPLCAACATKLEHATTMYGGEFLTGIVLDDAAEFNEWALWQREALHERLLQTLHKLVVFHESAGEYAAAQTYAERLVALEPWRERGHRQLMRILAAMGHRAAALAQFERAQEALAAELGVDPSAETVALYEAIRDERFLELQPPTTAEAVARHNLPRSFTTFVGREREAAEIERRLALPSCALLTVVGPGGNGKTRLAVEVARRQAGRYRDGAWLVSLAPVEAAQDLAQAIADALALPPAPALPVETHVIHYLQKKELLLVLDNFEQLLPAPTFLLALLQSARNVQLLVTSRMPLNLQAEWLFPLGGLQAPATGDEAAVQQAAAGQLFLDRMKQRFPHFSVTGSGAEAVARLCHLLGGMPLAIELAAAQAEPEGLQQLVQSVEANVDVLTTTMSDFPVRQRSLRAAFDYSWRLLSGAEQQTLAALSVFRNPFSSAAGREVAGSDGAMLARLVQKSFLESTQNDLYLMHEVIRQYASEALAQMDGAVEGVRARHSAYYLGLLSAWQEALRGPRQGQTLEQMALVLDDVRAAWQWALSHKQSAALLPAETAFYLFFDRRSRFREGARLFAEAATQYRAQQEDALTLATFLGRESYFRRRLNEYERAAPLAEESVRLAGVMAHEGDPVRAFGLRVLGILARHRGEHEAARRDFEQSLSLCRALGDEQGIASALDGLGMIASDTGDYERALSYFEDSLMRQQLVGDRDHIAACYKNIGVVNAYLNDLQESERLFEKSLAIRVEIGDLQGEAKLLNNLGFLAMRQGNLDVATARFEQSRMAFAEVGVERGVALSFLHLGEIAVMREEFALANQQLAQAMVRATDIGATTVALEVIVALGRLAARAGATERAVALLSLAAGHPQAKAITRTEAQEVLAAIQTSLDEQAVEAARKEGERLTLVQVANEIREQTEPQKD